MRKSLFYCAILGLIFVFGVSCVTNDAINLGATFPLTGEVSSYGVKAKNGIQLRIDEVNEAGGVNGRKIVVDFQDDRNSIKDAVSIFNTFSSIKKYPVVFGSAGSSITEALVPISLKERTLLISPISGSSALSNEKWKYFFRTIPSDSEQARKLADWVVSENVKKVAVVYTNNSWGKPLAETFMDLFTEQQGTVAYVEGVPENTSDFRTIIAKLKQYDFEAIVSPTYPREGGVLVKQLREQGVSVRLFGGDNWGAPEFLAIAGNAAEGVCFTYPSDSKSELWDGFGRSYKEKFGEEPDVIAAYAYDAASAVIQGMQNITGVLTSDLIREQLLLLNFEGVTGRISFKPNGDVNSEGYGKRSIRAGKAIEIDK